MSFRRSCDNKKTIIHHLTDASFTMYAYWEKSFWAPVHHVMLQLRGLATMKVVFKAWHTFWWVGDSGYTSCIILV